MRDRIQRLARSRVEIIEEDDPDFCIGCSMPDCLFCIRESDRKYVIKNSPCEQMKGLNWCGNTECDVCRRRFVTDLSSLLDEKFQSSFVELSGLLSSIFRHPHRASPSLINPIQRLFPHGNAGEFQCKSIIDSLDTLYVLCMVMQDNVEMFKTKVD